jgi:hypothetical protein
MTAEHVVNSRTSTAQRRKRARGTRRVSYRTPAIDADQDTLAVVFCRSEH